MIHRLKLGDELGVIVYIEQHYNEIQMHVKLTFILNICLEKVKTLNISEYYYEKLNALCVPKKFNNNYLDLKVYFLILCYRIKGSSHHDGVVWPLNLLSCSHTFCFSYSLYCMHILSFLHPLVKYLHKVSTYKAREGH